MVTNKKSETDPNKKALIYDAKNEVIYEFLPISDKLQHVTSIEIELNNKQIHEHVGTFDRIGNSNDFKLTKTRIITKLTEKIDSQNNLINRYRSNIKFEFIYPPVIITKEYILLLKESVRYNQILPLCIFDAACDIEEFKRRFLELNSNMRRFSEHIVKDCKKANEINKLTDDEFLEKIRCTNHSLYNDMELHLPDLYPQGFRKQTKFVKKLTCYGIKNNKLTKLKVHVATSKLNSKVQLLSNSFYDNLFHTRLAYYPVGFNLNNINSVTKYIKYHETKMGLPKFINPLHLHNIFKSNKNILIEEVKKPKDSALQYLVSLAPIIGNSLVCDKLIYIDKYYWANQLKPNCLYSGTYGKKLTRIVI